MKFVFALLTGSLMAAENPRVEYAMGALEEKRGNGDAAKAHYEKALSLDPGSLTLVENVVEIRLGEGDRQGAVKLLRDLAAASPDRVDVQLSYVRVLEQQGRGDALAQKLAVEVLENVLKKRPGNVPVISRLITIFRERGDKERAFGLMQGLPTDDPAAVEIYASASKTFFSADDLVSRDRVDFRYGKALLAHPADPELARAASEYFRTTGRMNDAVKILQDHVQTVPWALDLRTRLGILLFSAKRDAEGEAVLKQVVDIRPGSEGALQALAKFYRLRGDEAEARHYGAELLKIRGGSPREFVMLADEYLAAGDPRSARLLLEKGVFDHPDKPELAMKLAVATRLDPETKAKAGRLFREAEASVPDGTALDGAFLIESADVLAEEGNSKAAEERLRTAIKSFPPEKKKETAAALRKLAGIWEKEGRNAEAAKALKQRADGLEK